MEYARNRQMPKNYGGSYTPPDDEADQAPEQPRKFVLKEFVIIASDKDFYRGTRTAGPDQKMTAENQKAKGFAPPLTMHERDVWSGYKWRNKTTSSGRRRRACTKSAPRAWRRRPANRIRAAATERRDKHAKDHVSDL